MYKGWSLTWRVRCHRPSARLAWLILLCASAVHTSQVWNVQTQQEGQGGVGEHRADVWRHQTGVLALGPEVDDSTVVDAPHQALAGILRRLVAREGGYVDDPIDPGGCTNYGITRAGWEGVIGRPITCEQLRKLTPTAAVLFYERWGQQYGIWQLLDLDFALAEIVMDSSVLFGAGRVTKWMQLDLGIEDDGIIGQDTIEAIKARGPRAVAKRVLSRRLHSHAYRVSRDTSQARFLVGWINRCTDLMTLV
jgi:hypothetical protein